MTELQVFHHIEAFTEWRNSLSGRVGFVPTMGALHKGHAELLRRTRYECDHLVLSIFVNPAQFGPKEDYLKYPKTLEKDLQLAREFAVDAVFAPSAAEMYPFGFSTYVEETEVSKPLCGKFREGHFRGVTTVVLKLFQIVRPNIATFGMKDAQQFFVIERMTRDLHLPLQLLSVPTRREDDGLALSSRNVYLSEEDRRKAPLVYQSLLRVEKDLRSGQSFHEVLSAASHFLTHHGFAVQYYECLQLPAFQAPLQDRAQPHHKYLIAVAAFLEQTRLIDNLILTL